MPPPMQTSGSALALFNGFPAVVIFLGIIVTAAAASYSNRQRTGQRKNDIHVDMLEAKKDPEPSASPCQESSSAPTFASWQRHISTGSDEATPMIQQPTITSGDLVNMLSLPSPSIRRHSYLVDQDMDGHGQTPGEEDRHSSKSRVGSVTTIDGNTIPRKDMIIERGGWRRHAKVFGAPEGIDRQGTW